mgnify:CR=1 FL=1
MWQPSRKESCLERIKGIYQDICSGNIPIQIKISQDSLKYRGVRSSFFGKKLPVVGPGEFYFRLL